MTNSKTILFITLTLITTLLFAQKNEIGLLNGRFYLTFPDSAKNVSRATDIIAADANANNETRIVYDIGEKRIVFFAKELYVKNVDNKLEQTLINESSQSKPIIKTVFSKDSVMVVSSIPTTFDNKKEAILIRNLIIQNSDSTLSQLSIFINQKAYADKTIFNKISEDVVRSFKKGNKKLNLESHIEKFDVLTTKTVLKLTLPKDYLVTVDKKYDFEVYKIRKIRTYGDKTFADFTIYFGFYPTAFSTALKLSEFRKEDTDGEFMFQKIPWTNFEDKTRHLILREQLYDDEDIQKGAQIHIAMVSNNQQQIDYLTEWVKTILLIYDK